MICLDRCRAEGMKRQGLGGEILVFKKAEVKYVVKVNEQAQSINEYVAQHLLRALGFDDVPMELVEYGGRIYGATLFQEGITRIYPINPVSVPDVMKQTVLELYILNSIFNNADEGEFYLQGDKVISLDYGEALIPTFWLNIAINGCTEAVIYNVNVSSSINVALSVLSKYYDPEICGEAIDNLAERFEKLNINDMTECFTSLNESLFEGFAGIYYNYIKMVRNGTLDLNT